MTQWVEDVDGGRSRGPRGLLRAWVEVLVRPRAFFDHGVAPGDQAPGLVFAVAVVLVAALSRVALGVDAYPVIAGRPLVSAAFWPVAIAVLAAPVALHLSAAVQTILLAAVVDERAGVSETVQVIAYAAAPMALAGVPVPVVQVAVTAWAIALYVLGIAIVHDVSVPRATVVALVPAVLVFAYGFGTVGALETLVDAGGSIQ